MWIAIIWGIIILALLAAHYFVATEFYKVAAMKGWPQKKYRIMTLLLWFVGYMLIIALPDRAGESMTAIVSDDLPEL
jgi:predicted alpha/beta hydrolase